MKNITKASALSFFALFLLVMPSGLAYAASSPAKSSAPTTPPGLLSLPMQPAISKEDSYNWAGYAVSSSSPVTEAEGSWIEPSAVCNTHISENQGVVFWVGIDGLTTDTVEQTGTFAYCTGSKTPTYYAWYEFYPAQPIEIISGFTVKPGNVFNATIVGSSDTSFKVILTDVTTGQSATESNPSGFSASRGSAECITETPSGSEGFFYVPDFKLVEWGNFYTGVKSTCTATIDGKTSPIGSFGANSYELEACNYSSCTTIIIATTGLKSDKMSFENKWKNAGP